MVKLSNGHIIISSELVEAHFGESAQVNWVYYPKQNAVLIASVKDDLFKTLHKTNMSILKHKNESGQRSISVQELLIDNNIDPNNCILTYRADEVMKILTVYFSTETENLTY